MTAQDDVLVEINDLFINFYTYQGVVQAIEGVNLQIMKNETLGLVGETGCGKSVTASAIMKLILSPPGKMEAGSVFFLEPPEVRQKRKEYEADAQRWYSRLSTEEKRKYVATYGMRFTGFKKRVQPLTAAQIKKITLPTKPPSRLVANWMLNKAKSAPKNDGVTQDALRRNFDLLQKSNVYMQKIRGRFISMIFQEPTSALNPVFTAGDQIAEVILHHRRAEMADKVLKRIDRELQLVKKHNRPRRVVRIAKKTMKQKKGAKVVTKVLTEKTIRCSVCGVEVVQGDAWCAKCGSRYYSAVGWALRPYLLKSWKQVFLSVKKRPDSRNPVMSRIPILRRYERDLHHEALMEAVKMLEVVRIPDPKGVATRYPYELSGGMQQRVMIAIALACNPKLLIADEPTTALDVTIQGQILKLMRELKAELGSSILLITHNLGVVAEMCDRVGVMYAGSMAEVGSVKTIFKSPLHPYTQGLMKAVPSIQMSAEKLFTIRGTVPNLIFPPSGCRFHPRCDEARAYCKKVKPELTEVEPGHFVSCHMVAKTEGYLAE